MTKEDQAKEIFKLWARAGRKRNFHHPVYDSALRALGYRIVCIGSVKVDGVKTKKYTYSLTKSVDMVY